MSNSFLLIGSAKSGKSTFLAVNYFLLQSVERKQQIFLEENDSVTAKILFEWQEQLNEGLFPKRNEIHDNYPLNLSLWLSRKKQIKINNYDVSGELYNKFDPRSESSDESSIEETEEEKLIDGLIKDSLVHVVIINANIVKDEKLLRIHDNFYHFILNKIRALTKYKYNDFIPVILVFTKTDTLELDGTFNPILFAKKFFPKTYKQYNFFFSSKSYKKGIFACSIGEVEGNSEDDASKIIKFQPKGYMEVMDLIINMASFTPH
jgi:hypothetical protein